MKFTKEQRKLIYLKALELVAGADIHGLTITKRHTARYVCHAVGQAAGIVYTDVTEHFPEAYAFRNPDLGRYDVWLSDGEDNDDTGYDTDPETGSGNKLRQLVLIFAAELCGDPDFQADVLLSDRN
jgi:hypothetical protein